MKWVIVSTIAAGVVNTINAAHSDKKVEVIKLTDGRNVIDPIFLTDPEFADWGTNAAIKSLPVIEVTGSVFPENKILVLCKRDKRTITTPEQYEAAKAYYLGRGEL